MEGTVDRDGCLLRLTESVVLFRSVPYGSLTFLHLPTFVHTYTNDTALFQKPSFANKPHLVG